MPRWLLREFCADGKLHVADLRRRCLTPPPRSVEGVGWLPHFYASGQPHARDAWLEAWLADTIDARGPDFLRSLRGGAFETDDQRHALATMVMAQRIRTPRGMASIRASWPDDETPHEDDLRERLAEILGIGHDDDGWLIANARWSLVTPPPGRTFVLSDNPVTSRYGDPPRGGPGIAEPTLPFSPTECLLVTEDEPGKGPTRQIAGNHYREIVRRTVQAADRWAWAHDEDPLRWILDDMKGEGLELVYPTVGRW